ncbi:hypothetical protein GALL_209890 [mine drainage metagenome]|jgi:hypothetical protein|uniref:Uncharacterized protein n=1 Tax=mine drainage metagenome TaxID=410659 RepID=A0A1J5RLZ1_9ZZZZ
MIYLYTIGLLLFVMLAFVLVQSAANWFAHRHPEFGAARRMGEGCCGKCSGDTCENNKNH